MSNGELLYTEILAKLSYSLCHFFQHLKTVSCQVKQTDSAQQLDPSAQLSVLRALTVTHWALILLIQQIQGFKLF